MYTIPNTVKNFHIPFYIQFILDVQCVQCTQEMRNVCFGIEERDNKIEYLILDFGYHLRLHFLYGF